MFMTASTSFTPAERIALERAGVDLGQAGMAPDRALTGLSSGSLIETPQGWRPVGLIAAGMRVATWDGGFAEVAGVARRSVWPGVGTAMIEVPGGAIGNCEALKLAPDQQVMLDTDVAEAVLGDRAVLVAARHLVGYRGIACRRLAEPVTVVSLAFAEEEAVFVSTGALIGFGKAADGAAGEGFFSRLTGGQARALIELLQDDTVGGAIWHAAA